jgi:hypothetical protein
MVADGSRQPGRRRIAFAAIVAVLLAGWIAATAAQFAAGAFEPDAVELDHPAIGYRIVPRTDPVARLSERLLAGTATLAFEGPSGYLRSLLDALDIPVESQIAVFSKTSLRSIPTASDGAPLPWLGNATMDHRTPPEERWGGWYVTGRIGAQRHLGNLTTLERRAQELPAWDPPSRTLTTLEGRFDTNGYLSVHSDIVALLVFQHQARVMNLLTRVGWLARLAAADNPPPGIDARLSPAVNELVDSMLFVGEAPLEDVSGTSGFAERFTARGPRDSKGRSLRELELKQRLMRYPCSYTVYSAAFDGLPDSAREMVYRRMKRILSGEERETRYAHIAPNGAAVIEILRETKKNVPGWF